MKTSKYPYGSYPFDEFNPLQSLVFPHIETDDNVVIEAPTSSGKTICAEILAGKALGEGKRMVYLSPLKALVEEKVEDWTSAEHSWRDYTLCPLTGDYSLSKEKEEELSRANIILATFEMMAVRSRRSRVENNSWIDEVGVLVVDEAHFISSKDRGDHLENALVAFTHRNKQARIVVMSATLANSDEFVHWLATLNSHPTELIRSDYRPCKLHYHFPIMQSPPGRRMSYAVLEDTKVETAVELVTEYPDDQWLLFVHGKPTGNKLVDALRKQFPQTLCTFHNADKSKEQKAAISKRFKEGKLRYLVATSTLAFGVNLPARRVAILGVKRGYNDVDPMDIVQECGRAGRPKYDTEGDAYVILQSNENKQWINLLTGGLRADSVIVERLGLHLIGEITEKRVNSLDESKDWARRLFVSYQGNWDDKDAENVFRYFEKENIIHKNDDGDGYHVTQLGMIAAHHYFDPRDVAAWRDSIFRLQSDGNLYDEIGISLLVGGVKTKPSYIPKELRELASDYLAELKMRKLYAHNDNSLVRAAVINQVLSNPDDPHINNNRVLSQVGLHHDLERVISCIDNLERRVMKIRRRPLYWGVIKNRIKYGIMDDQAELCCLPGIGPRYSGSLVKNGVRSFKEFLYNKQKVSTLIPLKAHKESLKFLKKYYASKKRKTVKKEESAW